MSQALVAGLSAFETQELGSKPIFRNNHHPEKSRDNLKILWQTFTLLYFTKRDEPLDYLFFLVKEF